MASHEKAQIQTLLDSNPAFIDEAIRLLGANQTADELAAKTTNCLLYTSPSPRD